MSCVAISFCNQVSSPEYSLCILDLQSGNVNWASLANSGLEITEGLGGVCGAVCRDHNLFVATQGESAHLLIWNLNECRWTSSILLPQVVDAHSLVLIEDDIFLISTGTNEIYRIPINGTDFGVPQLYWQYPLVSYDRDDVHLNGLTRDGNRLIASCFGTRDKSGKWQSMGRVFYIDTLENILTDLDQPHTPYVENDTLCVAESKAGIVHILSRSHVGWQVKKNIFIGGYVRGLSFLENDLLVGVSAARFTSRSQRTVLSDDIASNGSQLLLLNTLTGEKTELFDIECFGREIYDLCALPMGSAHIQVSMPLKERIRSMERQALLSLAQLNALSKEYKFVVDAHNSLVRREERRASFKLAKIIRSVLSKFNLVRIP